MAQAQVWYKGNEDSKPDVKADVLEVRKAKAFAIKSFEQKQKAELKKKFECSAPDGVPKEEERILTFANKIAGWRENFRKYRQKQKQFSQWVRAADFFPVVVYGGKVEPYSKTTFDLSNFQELNIPQGESYNFFNRCWMMYDKNGSGRLKYEDFELLLKDIGFQFGRPSWKEVDPQKTRKVTWQRAVRWWSKSTESAEKALNRPSSAKIKAVRQKRRERYAKNSYEKVDLLTSKQLERARKNARTKTAAERRKFREFRQKNKGRLGARTIVDVFKSKLNVKYDITDYTPLDLGPVPAAQQRMVEVMWQKYDKDGVGNISYDTFQTLCKEQNVKVESVPAEIAALGLEWPQAGKPVQFNDFIRWWFRPATEDQEEKKEETPSKNIAVKKKVALLSRKQVKAKAKEFQKKFALDRSKFRKFRKEDKKAADPWRVEILTKKKGEAKRFEYSLKDYERSFIPAGKEGQLEQLDRIWKEVDTDGAGQLEKGKFQKLLKRFGLDSSAKVVDKLVDASGNVTFEKFSTWWFNKSEDIVPVAPAPPAAKKQKASTIRSSVASINKKYVSKWKLNSDAEWARSRSDAQKVAQAKSADFKKFRIAKSPMKGERPSPVKKMPIVWWAVGTPKPVHSN